MILYFCALRHGERAVLRQTVPVSSMAERSAVNRNVDGSSPSRGVLVARLKAADHIYGLLYVYPVCQRSITIEEVLEATNLTSHTSQSRYCFALPYKSDVDRGGAKMMIRRLHLVFS